MPKVTYNPEKVQKQKKIIGLIAVILLLIIMIISFIYQLRFYICIPLALAIFGAANVIMRRIGKTSQQTQHNMNDNAKSKNMHP